MRTITLSLTVFALATASLLAVTPLTPTISGDYLEVRTCDVFTGPCFANAEMGVTGKEGMLVWSIKQGHWQGTSLDGLSVIAVLRTTDTLGHVRYQPREGKAVLIVDARANPQQQIALAEFARAMAGKLTSQVVDVKTSKMEIAIGNCGKQGCASIKAPGLVEITTRCLGSEDHLCGNEETFYPPLTDVAQALPVFTELAAYRGNSLGLTWEGTGQRNAFLGTFAF